VETALPAKPQSPTGGSTPRLTAPSDESQQRGAEPGDTHPRCSFEADGAVPASRYVVSVLAGEGPSAENVGRVWAYAESRDVTGPEQIRAGLSLSPAR
jgi:hypothetical protein